MSGDTVLPVVVIGAGPAGASAAAALARREARVVLLDAGTSAAQFPPAGGFLDLRTHDAEQWRWQLGERYDALDAALQSSPKLRVPGLRSIFEGYAQANALRPEPGFHLVGALAAGGLSNAWGCGVARFDDNELGPLRRVRREMDDAYADLSRHIGLSGAADDALADFFGVDGWAQPALPLDSLHERLWRRRERIGSDMALGRARSAVLNEDREGRARCDLSGTCLWGCPRQATWSAAFELPRLRAAGVQIHQDIRVRRLRRDDAGDWHIEASTSQGDSRDFSARKVLLATGTIASTRLVLDALPEAPAEVRLLSNPMAAFLLFLPSAVGMPRTRAFGLAQLSFLLRDAYGPEAAMGNVFSTAGLPLNEFLAHLPVTRRAGLPLLRSLLRSTVVANVFLPGSLSAHTAGLDRERALWIRGGASDDLAAVLSVARTRLASGFRRIGAWMLPGSFVPAAPGADVHYASTLPIRDAPATHECQLDGQVAGLPGLYVVDGASLPSLPAKAHTLTIMANAARIAAALPLH